MKNFQEIEKARFLTQSDFFKVTLENTPADKLQWKPDDKSMSAMEMAQHLTGSNYFFSALIKGEKPGAPAEAPKNPTPAQVMQDLQKSCDMIANTIASVPDQKLDNQVELGTSGRKVKVRFMVTVPGTHLAYHWGQLSYLQKMWGDDKDHFFVDTKTPFGSRY